MEKQTVVIDEEKKLKQNQVVSKSYFTEHNWMFSLDFGGLKVYKKNGTNVMWNPETEKITLVYTDEDGRKTLAESMKSKS